MQYFKFMRVIGIVALTSALAQTGIAFARNSSGHIDALSKSQALGLYTEAQQRSGFDSCTGIFPQKRPLSIATIPGQWKAQALCSNSFAVLYSGLSKTPLVVVERLSKTQLGDASGNVRSNQFYADPRLSPQLRAELDDFKGSNLDRGHMSPAANQPDHNSMAQSFALSNMVPQDPTNNRKIWAKIESDVRKFSRRASGNLFVFSGPIFDSGHLQIGLNNVWVPTRLFKLVYDEDNQKAWAYILPNASNVHVSRPVDYASFRHLTGWKFLDNVTISGSVFRKN